MMKNVVTMKLLQRFLANALPPAALHALLRLLGVPSCSPGGPNYDTASGPSILGAVRPGGKIYRVKIFRARQNRVHVHPETRMSR
jgi:hypothetical protein